MGLKCGKFPSQQATGSFPRLITVVSLFLLMPWISAKERVEMVPDGKSAGTPCDLILLAEIEAGRVLWNRGFERKKVSVYQILHTLEPIRYLSLKKTRQNPQNMI